MDKLEELKAKFRAQHPEWSEEQVQAAAAQSQQEESPSFLSRMKGMAGSLLPSSKPTFDKEAQKTFDAETQLALEARSKANKEAMGGAAKFEKQQQAMPVEPAAISTEQKPKTVKPSAEKDAKEALKVARGALDEVPEDARPDFEARMKALDDRFEAAMKQYQKDKDETKKAQLISNLFNGVTQLMAGAYGAKHGVDLSHIRGAEWDWKGDFDRILDEMKIKQEDIRGKRGELSKEKELYSQEERADKRLAAQEAALAARQGMQESSLSAQQRRQQEHDIAMFNRQLAAQEAANARQGRKLSADSYLKQGEVLAREAASIEKDIGPKGVSLEEAKQRLAGQEGLDQSITPDIKTWFGLGEGKVSGGALAAKYRAAANALFQKGRELGAEEPSSKPAGRDPKIEEYAKQYNLPYEQAESILVKRGYKPAK